MIEISEEVARNYYINLKDFQEYLVSQFDVIPLQTTIQLFLACECLMEFFCSKCKKDFSEE